jgi:hypothetical protein
MRSRRTSTRRASVAPCARALGCGRLSTPISADRGARLGTLTAVRAMASRGPTPYTMPLSVRTSTPTSSGKLSKTAQQTTIITRSLSQWRIVRPGAVRIGTSGGSNLKSGAFRNVDGSVAVVVINSAANAQTVSVALSGYPVVQAWYTDNTHDMSVAAVTVGSDGAASASVPGHAMISFLFKPASNGTVV